MAVDRVPAGGVPPADQRDAQGPVLLGQVVCHAAPAFDGGNPHHVAAGVEGDDLEIGRGALEMLCHRGKPFGRSVEATCRPAAVGRHDGEVEGQRVERPPAPHLIVHECLIGKCAVPHEGWEIRGRIDSLCRGNTGRDEVGIKC
jgi:hypothetical protein